MANCGGKPGSSRRCGIPLARCGGRAAQFAPCLHDDLATARNAKAGQHQGDDEIGPGGAGAEYAGGSGDHRAIADRVVARADTDRAAIGVAVAMTPEYHRTDEVRDARRDRSDEHTPELPSLMGNSLAHICM